MILMAFASPRIYKQKYKKYETEHVVCGHGASEGKSTRSVWEYAVTNTLMTAGGRIVPCSCTFCT